MTAFLASGGNSFNIDGISTGHLDPEGTVVAAIFKIMTLHKKYIYQQ